MSYTIKNLQDDLRKKFGEQFTVNLVKGMVLSDKVKSGREILMLNRLGEPQHGIQFNRLAGLPKGSRLHGFRAGSEVAFDSQGDLIITAETGTTFNLKRVGKVLIEAIEAANTDFPQRLLIARNEIAYELEREKEKYSMSFSKAEFTVACDELLKPVDQLCEHPNAENKIELINKIHTCTKKIMELNGNIPGLHRAISGFLVAAIFAGVALAIAGWMVAIPLVAFTGLALIGVGTFGGAAYGSSRGQSLTDGLVMQVSKVGRLANHFSSLFAKGQPVAQDVTPASSLQLMN